MTGSEELMHFYRFINAVDILDATKNEIMIWKNSNGFPEIDFNVIGKPARARLYVEVGQLDAPPECGIILFDERHEYDNKLIVNCDTPEEYILLAERMVSYLHLPRDTF